jgi:hypothetical protein
MAEFTLDEAYKPTQEGHAFSLDEAYGPKEEPKGFMANLRNPVKLWTEESMVANIAKYVSNRPELQKKAFESEIEEKSDKLIVAEPDKHPPWIVERALKRTAERKDKELTFKKVWESAKGDPGKFGAEIVNAVVADPYLLLPIFGTTGGPARVLGTAAGKMGPKAATAGRVVGGAAEAGAMGGAIQAPITAAKQLADEGRINAGELGSEVLVAAGMSAPFGVASHARAPKARVDPLADVPVQPPTLDGEAQAAGRAYAQQQINSLLDIKSPEERAAAAKARRKEVRAGFNAPEPDSFYASTDESIYAAEVRTKQNTPADQPDTSTVYDTTPAAPEPSTRPFLPVEDLSPAQKFREGARILQTPPHERTAADLARLRRLREGGSLSPELSGLLGVAGIGALAGASLDDDALRGAVFGTAAGAAAALPFMGRGAGVRQAMGQTGAVKGPGGLWHPEAVERLSKPLTESLSNIGRQAPLGEWDKAAATATTQADRMIKGYLNKHAGTATDPLKDVKIPFGEGTKRWEEITDKVFKGTLVDKHPRPPVNARTGETLWEVNVSDGVYPPSGGFNAAQNGGALQSYLSHVGDYLRQNVDPAKLPQYDLVRAVKETAANDTRVAKQMEKAFANSTKQLPVYKEYPDGFKWVELKLPEKLTEEQAKGVRLATKNDPKGYITGDGEEFLVKYVAVDADGKPVKNTYTQETAGGRTPEEAYLAGRLAEEGNQMGHCVGGYCEGVAAGESKIYSLRDAKGKSHVTVETEPGFSIDSSRARTSNSEFRAGIAEVLDKETIRKINSDYAQNNPDISLAEFVIRHYPEVAEQLRQKKTDDIAQIKGKQNRAPNAEYLPYVQDFVKSGKWGDVRDLENAGLQRLGNNVDIGVNSKLWGQEFATIDEISQAIQAGELQPNAPASTRVNQRGSIDQQLLIGMGAIGLGGLIGSQLTEDPGKGLVMGALAGGALSIPAARARFKAALDGLDKVGGIVSTRILNHSPAIHKRAVDRERTTLTRSHAYLNRTLPWLQGTVNLDADSRAKLSRALFEEDAVAIAELNKGNPEMVSGWREVRNVLSELAQEAIGRGRFKEALEDYFPRRVKDFKGLRESLDLPVRTQLENVLAKAEADAMKQRKTGLTEAERSKIINRELRNYYRTLSKQPGYSKDRKIQDVTQKLESYYYTPQESLTISIMEMVDDLETAKFFGRDLVETEKGGKTYINYDDSIGNLVGREMAAGKLTPEGAAEIESILRSRFGPGNIPTNRYLQEVKSIGYAALLGDPTSAVVQFGDPFTAFYSQGARASITAIARTLTGKQKITAKDYGLADHISSEITQEAARQFNRSSGRQKALIAGGAATGMLAGAAMGDGLGDVAVGGVAGAYAGLAAAVGASAALNKVFRQSGFAAIDRFGKDVHLNAAHNKYTRWAMTPEGRAKIAEKYGAAYGDELPQLIKDLQAGAMTEPVRSLLFAELSRMQPISKLEMPQTYLDNPNGRVAYMLKTWMAKQFDVMRRDAYNEFRKGNVKEGIKNTLVFSFALGAGGMSAQALKSYIMGQDIDLSSGALMENMLKTFGWGEYTRDKMEKNPITGFGESLVPPVSVMDDIIKADPKAVKYIPIIGDLYYNWELGGREEAELRAEKKAKKDGKDYMISPRAEQYKEAKKEKAELKRERAAQ